MGGPSEQKSSLVYGIDDVPPLWETFALGFQHYLTMFGSTVAIPLLLAEPLGLNLEVEADRLQLALLIGTMFFVSGITTILQTTHRQPLAHRSGRHVFDS